MVYLIGTVCALPETTISANKISLISLHPQLLASLMSRTTAKSNSDFLIDAPPASSTPYYLTPDVASHGVILIKNVWNDFLFWYENHNKMSIQNLSKTFLSIVDQKLLNSSLIYSWYVRDSSITSMWTLHFTIFCLMKKYQTVYPNLYHSTYVSHMREKGFITMDRREKT